MVSQQTKLADKAQNVVGQAGKGHDQGVGGELAGRQPLQVHIGLELTVELFAGAVIVVEPDDLLFRQVKRGPPAFPRDIGSQQPLTVTIYGALRYPDHQAAAELLPLVLLKLIVAEDGHPLAVSGRAGRAFPQAPFEQSLTILLAGVPLQDVVDFFVAAYYRSGFNGIVGGIEPEQ